MPGEVMLAGFGVPRAKVPINPPASYGWGWWMVLAAALLGLVLLWWWTRRVLRAADPAPATSGLETLRAETLASLDDWHARARSGQVTAHQAAAGLSAGVRRFVGIATDSSADYSTLPQLRRDAVKDPRLEPVVQFVAGLAPGLFDDAATLDLDWAHDTARDVVSRWR